MTEGDIRISWLAASRTPYLARNESRFDASQRFAPASFGTRSEA